MIEDVMIRISVLWIFLTMANSAHYAMYVCFEPGAIQKMACLHTPEENGQERAHSDWGNVD
jgi:hypothetical protein